MAKPKPKPRSPRPVAHGQRDEITRAILASDEPLADIAGRFGITKSRVQQLYKKMIDDGEAVPERRPGRVPVAPSDTNTVGGRIVTARLARGLTQRQLAASFDPPVTQIVIARAERAGDAVQPDIVWGVARALGIDPAALDPRLPPAGAVSLVRVVDRLPNGQRWEPLRPADREAFGELWEGPGPASDRLGELVDRAAEDGVSVVLRGDLPVRIEPDKGGER